MAINTGAHKWCTRTVLQEQPSIPVGSPGRPLF